MFLIQVFNNTLNHLASKYTKLFRMLLSPASEASGFLIYVKLCCVIDYWDRLFTPVKMT